MAEKTPSSVRPTRFSRAMDRLYRYNYGVGLRTARLGRRIWRWLFPRLTAVGGWLWRRWQVLVVRPFRRQHRKLGRMYAAFPTAWRELAAAWKKKPLSLFPCLGGLIKRAARRYREEWLILWRLAGPVAAVLVFAVTVAAWSHTNFCLALQYRGEKLGYIESETTYSEAAAMAVARVMNVDNSFEVEAAPTLAVTVQGRHDTLSDTELCDAILRTAGDSIAESTGLYVDETFVGAAESAAELETVLQSIQDGYYDKTDSNQRAEFVQTVDMVEGLFPSQSVVSADELKSRLTSEAVVKKTYVVQPGDTLSTIAVKNDMTLSALRAMNPSYASTDMVHIGDELLIQRPQPFLQVKVIKTITSTDTNRTS